MFLANLRAIIAVMSEITAVPKLAIFSIISIVLTSFLYSHYTLKTGSCQEKCELFLSVDSFFITCYNKREVINMLYYKIDVLGALKEKGYSTYRIRQEKIIGEAQVTKIRNGEIASKEVLNKLCALLDMQPGDILGYRPDEKDTR